MFFFIDFLLPSYGKFCLYVFVKTVLVLFQLITFENPTHLSTLPEAMEPLSSLQYALIERAGYLVERAQRDYVWTMSTLQQLSKDKLISLLEGGLDRYEDFSETLLKHKLIK